MNITLTRTDGEVIFREWPHQVTLEVTTNTLHLGTAETGMAWLMYNNRKFVWQELDINGDLTGTEYHGFKIGVMR